MGPKERVSALLGVKYLSANKKFITETGVVFSHDEVRDKSSADLKKMYEQRLSEELHDYAYTKSTGFFRKHKNPDKLRERLQDMTNDPSVISYKEPGNKIHSSVAVVALRIAMLVVGCATILLSANYTTEFLLKSNTMFISVVLSWAMIIFSVSAFDLIIYFWIQHKRSMKLLSFVFAVLWLVVVSFSMFSTMEVNFTRYKALEKESVQEYAGVNTTRLSATALENRIRILETTLQEKRNATAAYSQREVVSAWYLLEMQKDVSDAQAKLEAAYSELEQLYKSDSSALVTEETRTVTFYDSIEGMFGIAASKVHFFVHMLPAVFIDIIAPFSVAIALFLGGQDAGSKAIFKREEGDFVEEDRKESDGDSGEAR